MNNLITSGEMAKLASTTKRTILFYEEKGILKPYKKNSSGYRFYLEQQILDYQMILLLSTMGVSLGEMKKFLQKKGKISELFMAKKDFLKKEIRNLEFNLKNLDKFLANLSNNGTMVKPEIKNIKTFGVFYIEKIGSYAKMEKYCLELLGKLDIKRKKATTLAIYEDQGYRPKKSHIKVGVLAEKDIKIKEQYKNEVNFMMFHPKKVITYTHNGSGSTLSLFWKELEKYCRLHKIKIRKNTPDFEIYRRVNPDISKQFFEIYLSIV